MMNRLIKTPYIYHLDLKMEFTTCLLNNILLFAKQKTKSLLLLKQEFVSNQLY